MKEVLKTFGLGLLALVFIALAPVWGPFAIIYGLGLAIRGDE